MSRTIITILLIGLAFWVFARIRHRLTSGAPRRREPAFEKTVRCSACGIYVSARLAVEYDGRHYCCHAHVPQQDTP